MSRLRQSKRRQMTGGGAGLRVARWLVLLIVAGALPYLNSLNNAFVYDDRFSIVENPRILNLLDSLTPPNNNPLAGRPVASLSFALNHAMAGASARAFRLGNLAIHLAAGIILFGIVRRTLLLPQLIGRFGGQADALAFVGALFWIIHPLQSEVINYITQRTESLAGFLYLFTLYTSIRAAQSSQPLIWTATAIVSCALGMATKEVMVTAPIAVVLYDWAFLQQSPTPMRLRWPLYIGLMTTWIVLLALLAQHPRADSIGPASQALPYLKNQCWAIARYLRLFVWPDQLIMDYGPPRPMSLAEYTPGALLVLLAILATLVGLLRSRMLGFLGSWFFLILLPSSSVVPITTEVAAERRVYLSLAALILLSVVGGWLIIEAARPRLTPRRLKLTVFASVMMISIFLGYRTSRRNQDYVSERRIWETVVARYPHARAYSKLAVLADQDGDVDAAISLYRRAISAGPVEPTTHWNLGHALQEKGDTNGALSEYGEYVRQEPTDPVGRSLLGQALIISGRRADGIRELREAIQLKPDLPDPYATLGLMAMEDGDFPAAVTHFNRFLALEPDNPVILKELALAQLTRRELEPAIAAFRALHALQPDDADAQRGLEVALQAQASSQSRRN